jgi:hypothetical protein
MPASAPTPARSDPSAPSASTNPAAPHALCSREADRALTDLRSRTNGTGLETSSLARIAVEAAATYRPRILIPAASPEPSAVATPTSTIDSGESDLDEDPPQPAPPPSVAAPIVIPTATPMSAPALPTRPAKRVVKTIEPLESSATFYAIHKWGMDKWRLLSMARKNFADWNPRFVASARACAEEAYDVAKAGGKRLDIASEAYKQITERHAGSTEFDRRNLFEKILGSVITCSSREQVIESLDLTIRDINRFYAMGPFTQEDFTKLVLLRSLDITYLTLPANSDVQASPEFVGS